MTTIGAWSIMGMSMFENSQFWVFTVVWDASVCYLAMGRGLGCYVITTCGC